MRPRIVSLIASSTEIVCALGFYGHLVGRSHECDFPLSVKSLPVCTEPKFNIDGNSYEIDQRVKAILQEGLSVYRVHADQLKKLKPDLIVTQVQCEVCAVSEKDVEEAVCQLVDSKPKIVSLNPNSLKDLWEDIRKVATALNVIPKGEEVIADLKARMSIISQKIQENFSKGVSLDKSPQPPLLKGETAIPPFEKGGLGGISSTRPTVACIEWINPLMSCGNWLPELVEMAGGINLFGEAGKHSPWMTFEDLLQKNPDILIVLPCGFDIPKTREEMHWLTDNPNWKKLKAVQNKKVFLADGNQYFNRPGPRVVESLEILAEIFYPTLFNFGHHKKAWEEC